MDGGGVVVPAYVFVVGHFCVTHRGSMNILANQKRAVLLGAKFRVLRWLKDCFNQLMGNIQSMSVVYVSSIYSTIG